MTRCRANAQHVPGSLALEYYKQRTSVPGTLAITEATFIAARAGGVPNIPGIWNDEQIAGWKPIVDAVHRNGSFVFLQLWALGRAAHVDVLQAEGGYPLVSAGDVPLEGGKTPRPLETEEINEYVQLYASAAENAVSKAGFDGVEIHAANGYLIDQFLQTNANNRTDEYGGSVENRLRFLLEVTDTVVKAVGSNKVGIRFSPWSTFQGMRMADPVPTFTAAVTSVRDTHPDLAYLHIIEPKIVKTAAAPEATRSLEESRFLRDIWGDRPYIANSDFERDTAIGHVEKEGGLISFARHFISNPDLPLRLKNNIALAPYDYSTFYTSEAKGYTDYPPYKL